MRRARADGEHGAVVAVEVDERADKAACAVGEGDGLPEVDVRVDGDATEDVELDGTHLPSPPIAEAKLALPSSSAWASHSWGTVSHSGASPPSRS